jgi:hypothetical protein
MASMGAMIGSTSGDVSIMPPQVSTKGMSFSSGSQRPSAARARPAGVGKTQLTLLAALDGSACRLRIDREGLLLSLIEGRRPPGVSDDELGDALDAGVDRAEREGAVGGIVAFGLRLALKTGGPLALVKRLLE